MVREVSLLWNDRFWKPTPPLLEPAVDDGFGAILLIRRSPE